MTEYKNEQRKLNERARKIGAQINKAQGFDVKMEDDRLYRVSTRAELYALINNLEVEHGAG